LIGLGDEPIPGVTACIDDGVVGFVDAIAELVAAQIGPDILDGVQLGAVRGQLEQCDVVGDAQLAACFMPASPIDDHQSMRAGGHFGANLDQMQVHHLGVGAGQDERRAGPACRADRPKQIGPGIALVAGCWGTRAALGPEPGQGALLSDAGFILPPQIQRLGLGVRRQRIVYEGGEVALKDAWAAASWPG
jgi:hypothetical protein